jgi:hypothetical protein
VQAVMQVLRDMIDAGHPAVTDPKLANWLPAADRCGLLLCSCVVHLSAG